MSKPDRPRIYIDANVIIEMGKMKLGKHRKDRENDLWFFQQMLKAHSDKQIELITSSVTIAECTHAEGVYDQTVQDFFSGILLSGTLMTLIQDSVFVAEKARDLRWKYDIKLKGLDAIHVASAVDAGAKEFVSWDAEIDDKNQFADAISKLKGLGIHVILPSQSSKLPGNYRQSHLIRDSKKKATSEGV
jgi:hypothetical protein